MAHVQEVDVRAELTAARSAVEKLGRQVALLGRDQEASVGGVAMICCRRLLLLPKLPSGPPACSSA